MAGQGNKFLIFKLNYLIFQFNTSKVNNAKTVKTG